MKRIAGKNKTWQGFGSAGVNVIYICGLGGKFTFELQFLASKEA